MVQADGSIQMFSAGEAQRQQLCQCFYLPGVVRACQIYGKIRAAEFPHHLAAHTAGGTKPGNDAALAAAYGDGGKIPLPFADSFEKGGTLGAVGGGKGGVFNVAALVHGAVGAEQSGAYLKAGVGTVGSCHGIFCQFDQFFWGHIHLPHFLNMSIVGWGLAPTKMFQLLGFVIWSAVWDCHSCSSYKLHLSGFSSIYFQQD